MLGGATPPASLDVDFSGVRSNKGVIRICLTADPKNFPACVDDRAAIKRTVKATESELAIGGLAQGAYALAVIHDENGNARLDTFAGIPREGIGFSRNPKLGFGPPRFAAARFSLDGEPARQTVKLKYFL